MLYDYLIVGSGLFGSTFAYMANKYGKKCLVIDKRPHLGGNVYCQEQDGINVHKYGCHIFHTSNKEVWDFVNSLVPFNRFTNTPVAEYQGKRYNLPFNMNTFYQMWGCTTPAEAQGIIDVQKQEALTAMHVDGVTEPRNLEEQALCLVGRDIYEKLIKGYTEKQWGRPCSELPSFIIRRLPVRFTYDNNYFNDLYQGIPIGGYNNLIQALLHGIECRCNEDYFCNREYWNKLARKIVFTGQIDEFYNYCFGPLEYRTVYFKEKTLDTANYQGVAITNYTGREIPYTRIIEHKHFEHFGQDVYKILKTVITYEFSTEWSSDKEPFYPINDKKNTELYSRYKELADKETNIIFGGRLAEYKYYDMAPIIENVLKHPEIIALQTYKENSKNPQ